MKAYAYYVGAEVEVQKLHLNFYREIRRNGKPLSCVLGGEVTLTAEASAATLTFLEELLIVDKQLKDPDLPNPPMKECLKEVKFKVYDNDDHPFREYLLIDSHIKNFEEVLNVYENGTKTGSNIVTITFASAIQVIDKGVAKNIYGWRETEYKPEEYKPVVYVPERKKKDCRVIFDFDNTQGVFGFHKIPKKGSLKNSSDWEKLKKLHKVLPEEIKNKPYIPHWLSMRKGQSITLDIVIDNEKDYESIAFKEHPHFTFSPSNLKGQKSVRITCNQNAGLKAFCK